MIKKLLWVDLMMIATISFMIAVPLGVYLERNFNEDEVNVKEKTVEIKVKEVSIIIVNNGIYFFIETEEDLSTFSELTVKVPIKASPIDLFSDSFLRFHNITVTANSKYNISKFYETNYLYIDVNKLRLLGN